MISNPSTRITNRYHFHQRENKGLLSSMCYFFVDHIPPTNIPITTPMINPRESRFINNPMTRPAMIAMVIVILRLSELTLRDLSLLIYCALSFAFNLLLETVAVCTSALVQGY